MTILKDAPLGLTEDERLLNILVALSATGGCDRWTLRLVAQAVGIREYFDRETNCLQVTGEKPGQLVLTEAQR